jgi:hypothetical protein
MVVASTRPSSTDTPAFTWSTNRQGHDWLFPEDPVEPLAEREDSSNFKVALADFSAPPLPFFVRNDRGFGVGVVRHHDGFLPLIQTVLLRC